MKTIPVPVILYVCIVIGILFSALFLRAEQPTPDTLRISKLEARITLLTERLLSVEKRLDRTKNGIIIQEYRFNSAAGTFACRVCNLEEK